MGASRGVPSPPARRCYPMPYHMVFNHRLRAALYQCGFIWRPITVAGGTERDARCGHRLGLVFRLRAEPRDGESDAPRPGRDVREPRFHQGAVLIERILLNVFTVYRSTQTDGWGNPNVELLEQDSPGGIKKMLGTLGGQQHISAPIISE